MANIDPKSLAALAHAQARIRNSREPQEELKASTNAALARWAKNSEKYGVVVLSEDMTACGSIKDVPGIRATLPRSRAKNTLRY